MKRTSAMLALNIALAILFYATVIRPQSLSVTIVFALLLCAAPLGYVILRHRSPSFDRSMAASLLGTTLLWVPTFLTAYAYVGPFPEMMDKLVTLSMGIGVALLIASVLSAGRDDPKEQ